jgi:integrase
LGCLVGPRRLRAIRIKTDGYHSWPDAEIARFEARHPTGSRARLALALLLYTGQRRADVVHMGRQHVRDGLLYVRQQKTSVELVIPAHSELAAMIGTAIDRLTFLVNDWGRPFTVGSFSNCSAPNVTRQTFTIARRMACGRLRLGAWPRPAVPSMRLRLLPAT